MFLYTSFACLELGNKISSIKLILGIVNWDLLDCIEAWIEGQWGVAEKLRVGNQLIYAQVQNVNIISSLSVSFLYDQQFNSVQSVFGVTIYRPSTNMQNSKIFLDFKKQWFEMKGNRIMNWVALCATNYARPID